MIIYIYKIYNSTAVSKSNKTFRTKGLEFCMEAFSSEENDSSN